MVRVSFPSVTYYLTNVHAVLFGGGAENFLPSGSYKGQNYYDLFAQAGYNAVYSNTGLQEIDDEKRALGIFSISNMAKWLDRKVSPQNLRGLKNSPTGDGTDAVDQPGLKEMTLKVGSAGVPPVPCGLSMHAFSGD